MSTLDQIREERNKKLEAIRSKDLNPYPIKSQVTHTLAQISDNFDKFSKSKKKITVAGRVMAIREHGGAVFFDLFDGSILKETGFSLPKLQALLKEDEAGEENYKFFQEVVDVGDFVEVDGVPFSTKREEKTIAVSDWRILSKSLLPLPEKWHGLQDTEERFRRRYLDTIMSQGVRDRFILRAKIISKLRTFLEDDGFLEVETPVLQSLAGGATAEPFVTHHNALDMDLSLRIAPELYHKKLLIGGFPKVYEIGRLFRNEGIDVTHNPEFTSVEWYEAFSDSDKQKLFIEKLFKHLVKEIFGKLKFEYEGDIIDMGNKFQTISYFDIIRRYALIPNVEDIKKEELVARATQLAVKTEPNDTKMKILDSIYKRVCRPKIIQPTFLVDYPVDYLPLAKRREDNVEVVDAFQLIVGGMEMVKAFSELNDPLDQMARFEKEEENRKAGDREAQPADLEFVEALEYGMPPAGGVGIGIDRLVMLLTNQKNIREVILFPILRHR